MEPGHQVFPELDEIRFSLAAALIRAMNGSGPARQKLLGVKGEALAAATATNQVVLASPTRPAIERYTGVLYDALDYGGCPSPVRRRLDRQVLIFTGLWGAVRPRDPVPDYKLKMGARLPRIGPVATTWRQPLTTALAPAVDGRVVWDLLPGEHAKAWRPDHAAPARRITVRFLDDVERDGERRLVTVSHWNKLLKGALVRHLVEHQITDPDALGDFAHPAGYRYRADLSTIDAAATVEEAVFVARR